MGGRPTAFEGRDPARRTNAVSVRLAWLLTCLATHLGVSDGHGGSDGAALEPGSDRERVMSIQADRQLGLRLSHGLPGTGRPELIRDGRQRETERGFVVSVLGRSTALQGRSLGIGSGLGLSRGVVAGREEASVSRSRLYWSAALALTSGALAYWSSSEADDAYDRYLRSAGAERQRDQFASAEGYDRLSGAAFIAMEVGIALSTYLLFFGP